MWLAKHCVLTASFSQSPTWFEMLAVPLGWFGEHFAELEVADEAPFPNPATQPYSVHGVCLTIKTLLFVGGRDLYVLKQAVVLRSCSHPAKSAPASLHDARA